MRFLLGILTGLVFVAALAVVGTVGPGRIIAAVRGAMPVAQEVVPVALRESEFRLAPLRATTQYDAPVGAFREFEVAVGDQTRRWHGFGPAAGPDAALRPAIVLLHGSERNGAAMIDMWRAAAASNDLVLIAPDATSPSAWSAQDTSNAVLAEIVADAAKHYAVDPSQLYLFGHSAGASLALSLAMAQDGPWRAVAVHAGDIAEGEIKAAGVGAAPITLFIGDGDAFFPLDQVRTTAQAMAAQGHVTELVVMPDHDHWYYDIGPRLSSEVLARWFAG